MTEDFEIKNVWICGVGGVGGYFGGRVAYNIQRFNADELKVFFLARGMHLDQIKKNGLKLLKEDGEKIYCHPTLASKDIQNFPPPDLCLICVKSYDLKPLINTIQNEVSDSTVIIPLMNGIDIYERIRKILKKCVVLPSCVYVGSHIEKPGYVIQTGNPGFFKCGPDPKFPDFNPKPIIDFFEKMNIEMNWQENPYPAIWKKYLLVASFALVSAKTNQTLGEIIESEKSKKVLEEIMEEIVAIAEKHGVKLEDTIIPDTIEFCRDYPEVKPSYARDIEKGKKNEGDLFGGTIIRMGKELGVPTPRTKSIYNEST
ncbi:MAG: 2-dehydropantoate 2-reductase [Candidatus Lokiarchaeota archaeon]|nr:2-dehydropantoate 2-reductase [Candidatus Lokiarchaeota archaeon]